MLTKTRSVDTFTKNIDELISCQYVLSAKKITNLLKGISVSRLFYELFCFCTADFNYKEAKRKYFTFSGSYGKRFILPPDGKTMIALGFSLLYAIDSKEEDLASLLNEYFYESGINAAYKRFAKEFLTPFRQEVLFAANAMINSDAAKPLSEGSVRRNGNLLSDENIAIVKNLLEQSKGVILQYRIEPNLKSELIALYDNFAAELYDFEPQRIKVAYLGYKYGILFHKKHDTSLEKIEEILKKGGIL